LKIKLTTRLVYFYQRGSDKKILYTIDWVDKKLTVKIVKLKVNFKNSGQRLFLMYSQNLLKNLRKKVELKVILLKP